MSDEIILASSSLYETFDLAAVKGNATAVFDQLGKKVAKTLSRGRVPVNIVLNNPRIKRDERWYDGRVWFTNDFDASYTVSSGEQSMIIPVHARFKITAMKALDQEASKWLLTNAANYLTKDDLVKLIASKNTDNLYYYLQPAVINNNWKSLQDIGLLATDSSHQQAYAHWFNACQQYLVSHQVNDVSFRSCLNFPEKVIGNPEPQTKLGKIAVEKLRKRGSRELFS